MGEHHAIGLSTTSYKVLTADSRGDLFVMQHANQKKGGPPKHIHHNEDEFFFVLEDDYLIEVGRERLALRPGDSILGPPARWRRSSRRPSGEARTASSLRTRGSGPRSALNCWGHPSRCDGV